MSLPDQVPEEHIPPDNLPEAEKEFAQKLKDRCVLNHDNKTYQENDESDTAQIFHDFGKYYYQKALVNRTMYILHTMRAICLFNESLKGDVPLSN